MLKTSLLIAVRRWSFYILLIWSGLILICLIFVPETFHPVILARKASSLRKNTGNVAYNSESEIARASKPLSQALLYSIYRPFQLLLLEPMCLSLCIYSAFLLGILYLFFGAFPLIFSTNHGFTLWQTGLTFLGIVVGLVGALLTNPLWKKNYDRLAAKANANLQGENAQKPDPELRLPPAILGGILVPISLFWVGWTTYPSVHWIVPIIGSILFGAGLVDPSIQVLNVSDSYLNTACSSSSLVSGPSSSMPTLPMQPVQWQRMFSRVVCSLVPFPCLAIKVRFLSLSLNLYPIRGPLLCPLSRF